MCVLAQGGRSTLLNFQFTDNKNNVVYRMSAEEGKPNFENSEADCIAAAALEQDTIPGAPQPSNLKAELIGSTCVALRILSQCHNDFVS